MNGEKFNEEGKPPRRRRSTKVFVRELYLFFLSYTVPNHPSAGMADG
jgi:hypothetical protein